MMIVFLDDRELFVGALGTVAALVMGLNHSGSCYSCSLDGLACIASRLLMIFTSALNHSIVVTYARVAQVFGQFERI